MGWIQNFSSLNRTGCLLFVDWNMCSLMDKVDVFCFCLGVSIGS